jgi:hypothetical protein
MIEPDEDPFGSASLTSGSAGPGAKEITLAETLSHFDNEFAAVASGFDSQLFALWVGSGISLERAPGLDKLIGLIIEHLVSRLTTRDGSDKFAVALKQILQKSGLDAMVIAGLPYDESFASWTARAAIIDGLRQKYSSVLDVRVKGEDDDYLLWTAVDVRREYGSLTDPDSEHLAIAVLVLEGAVSKIVSANWDGLIEIAVDQLSLCLERPVCGRQILDVL